MKLHRALLVPAVVLGGVLLASCGVDLSSTEERAVQYENLVDLVRGERTAPEGFGSFVITVGCVPNFDCGETHATGIATPKDEMTNDAVCDSFMQWAVQSIAKDVMFAGAGEAEGSTVPFAAGKRDELVVSCVEALDGGGYVTATGVLHNRGEMVAGSSFEATLAGGEDALTGHAGPVFSLKIDRPVPES